MLLKFSDLATHKITNITLCISLKVVSVKYIHILYKAVFMAANLLYITLVLSFLYIFIYVAFIKHLHYNITMYMEYGFWNGKIDMNLYIISWLQRLLKIKKYVKSIWLSAHSIINLPTNYGLISWQYGSTSMLLPYSVNNHFHLKLTQKFTHLRVLPCS